MGIPAGRIGKMRVHESGRISIDINGYIVDMSVSIPLRYQQQVATIDDTNFTVLGDVKHRLVLTPDVHNFQWGCLLTNRSTLSSALSSSGRDDECPCGGSGHTSGEAKTE